MGETEWWQNEDGIKNIWEKFAAQKRAWYTLDVQ